MDRKQTKQKIKHCKVLLDRMRNSEWINPEVDGAQCAASMVPNPHTLHQYLSVTEALRTYTHHR